MEQHVGNHWWVIVSVAGTFIPIVATYCVFRTRQKALEVLKAYAERGDEPPASVLKALQPPESASPYVEAMSQFGFAVILGLGFGLVTAVLAYRGVGGAIIVLGAITTVVMIGIAVSFLIRALASRKP